MEAITHCDRVEYLTVAHDLYWDTVAQLEDEHLDDAARAILTETCMHILAAAYGVTDIKTWEYLNNG